MKRNRENQSDIRLFKKKLKWDFLQLLEEANLKPLPDGKSLAVGTGTNHEGIDSELVNDFKNLSL